MLKLYLLYTLFLWYLLYKQYLLYLLFLGYLLYLLYMNILRPLIILIQLTIFSLTLYENFEPAFSDSNEDGNDVDTSEPAPPAIAAQPPDASSWPLQNKKANIVI